MIENILSHPFSYALVAVLGAVAGWFVQRNNPSRVAKAMAELQAGYDALKQKYETTIATKK